MRFRDPPASPTRVGAATRPLRCPLRGLISSLAATARGLGWQKSSPVKVFCPAFLQKSGRGPGAAPLAARRSARNAPCANEAQEGVKGEPSPGVPPLRAAPPPAARAICGRPQSSDAGRGSAERGGLAMTVTAGRRGRRPLRGSAGRAACRGIFRARVTTREIVKTPPPATWDRRETGTGRGLAERSEAGVRVRGAAVPLSKKKRPRWGRFLLV